MFSISKNKGGPFLEDDQMQWIVKERYMTNALIHTYPNGSKSQALSESIGLYIDYLVTEQDQTKFQEQFKHLCDNFICRKEGKTYIRQAVSEQTTINRLIDDVRVITALKKASQLFNEHAYETLADELAMSISTVQRQSDVVVDFYDWEHEQAASQITLSYLTKDFFESMTSAHQNERILRGAARGILFFPEHYNTEKNEYVETDEVHLIDQLLIALNRANLGETSPRFQRWVKAIWQSEGKIGKCYDCVTQTSIDSEESVALYYYLYQYFSLIEEYKLAIEVRKRVIEMMTENVMHPVCFYDYFHFELLK